MRQRQSPVRRRRAVPGSRSDASRPARRLRRPAPAPPMNTASTVLTAAAVWPIESESRRSQTTSYSRAAAPESRYTRRNTQARRTSRSVVQGRLTSRHAVVWSSNFDAWARVFDVFRLQVARWQKRGSQDEEGVRRSNRRGCLRHRGRGIAPRRGHATLGVRISPGASRHLGLLDEVHRGQAVRLRARRTAGRRWPQALAAGRVWRVHASRDCC